MARALGGLSSAEEYLRPSSRILNCGCSRPRFIEREMYLARTQYDAVRHSESRLGSSPPQSICRAIRKLWTSTNADGEALHSSINSIKVLYPVARGGMVFLDRPWKCHTFFACAVRRAATRCPRASPQLQMMSPARTLDALNYDGRFTESEQCYRQGIDAFRRERVLNAITLSTH